MFHEGQEGGKCRRGVVRLELERERRRGQPNGRPELLVLLEPR